MSSEIFIVVILSGILGIGLILFVLNADSHKKVMKQVNKALGATLESNKNEKLFVGTHYNFSLYQYNYVRLMAGGIGVIVGVITVSKEIVLFSVLAYIMFYPKENLWGMPLPFKVLYGRYRKRDKQLKNDELFQVLSLLKNIMVQLRDNPKGADYIIDYLASSTVLTRAAFLKFLNLMRLGRVALAESTFVNELDTTLAADTAKILIQLDQVDTMALEQNLISLQNEIREIENTHKQTRNELFSDLILIPIIITMMLVFLNFILVAYIGELAKLDYFFR